MTIKRTAAWARSVHASLCWIPALVCFGVVLSSQASQTVYVDAARPDDSGNGLSWAAAKQTIQAAVNLAVDGDTVLVTNGVYASGGAVTPKYALTNRVCITNNLFLRSVNGPDVTCIEGAPAGNGSNGVDAIRCVFMKAGTLAGFTLSNGYTMATGGANDWYEESGGGLWLTEGCVVSNCLITGNRAGYYGGGVTFTVGGRIENCTIKGNTAGSGGGVHILTNGTLFQCTIADNTVSANGGGVILNKGGELTECTVTGNSAGPNGGGAYMSGGGLLDRCYLIGNITTQYSGGGVFCTSGAVVRACQIYTNVANLHGGGAYLNGGGVLNQCVISSNAAKSNGGGVQLRNGGTMNNCLLSANAAQLGGGGYFYSNGVMKNCTAAGNTASTGGGVYFYGGGFMVNSISWSNKVSTSGGNITLSGGGTIDHSCASQGITNGVNGCTTNHPLFVSGSDYHLQSLTPCINAGSNAYAPTNDFPSDLDGNPRIRFGVVDMGACERQTNDNTNALYVVEYAGPDWAEPVVQTCAYGTVITCSAPANVQSADTQYVVSGWVMDGNEPTSGTATGFTMTVTNNAELTWLWATNYWLDTGAGANGSVSPGDGWQAGGEIVNITATADAGYLLTGWSGDAAGIGNPLRLMMDAPKSVSAQFGTMPEPYAGRMEIDLSGTWQVQLTNELVYPPAARWSTTTVPKLIYGWDYKRAWFRKLFVMSNTAEGAVLKLCFGSVKFNSQVWLNGVFVGGCFNGYDPFELDVSAAIRLGATNELLVGVYDWTGVFSNPVDLDRPDYNGYIRNMATNALLSPIGGQNVYYGIPEPVKLVSVPSVFVQEVFAIPSVQNSNLTLRLLLTNAGVASCSMVVSNQVLDSGSAVLSFAPVALTLSAGASTNLEIQAAWTNAHYWSHEDPYLYEVETTVSGNDGSTDRQLTRFGFREFRIVADQLYLNGIPIHMLATSFHPSKTILTDEQIRNFIRELRAGNNNAVRFHTQPWDERWYRIADEEGLMVVCESAVYGGPSTYRWQDPVFWTHYNEHLTAMVKREWNHPAVVMWSMENEVLVTGANSICPGMTNGMAEQALYVKSLDPTRAVTFESDLDVGGVADVLGMHYPHEYGDYHLYPNAAYWMDHEANLDQPELTTNLWQWDRAKPLYIGEFLWMNVDAEALTILFGDQAYADRDGCRRLGQDHIWRMQIPAYRYYGVSGISPFTIVDDIAVFMADETLFTNTLLYLAQQASYHPNAVIGLEYNTHFFCGETNQRTLAVFNDRLTGGAFELKWSVDDGLWESVSFSMTPAEMHQEIISFVAPTESGAFNLNIELLRGGVTVFTNTLTYQAISRAALSLPSGLTAGVYDPVGSTRTLLDAQGLPYVVVTDLQTADYNAFGLLLIGAGALPQNSPLSIGTNSIAAQWQAFMYRGGWVVVTEQTNYPNWMPLGMQVTNYAATYAYANEEHPIMDGLTAADMRWWADDHLVVQNALLTPSRGNVRNLSPVGSTNGLEYAAALEYPVGVGGMICAQWLLTEKMAREPMAQLLLQRILNYCGSESGTFAPVSVGLLGNSQGAAGEKLKALGLDAVALAGRLADTDLSSIRLLVVAGDDSVWTEAAAHVDELDSYVQNGGVLLLHAPNNAFLSVAQPVLFPELETAPAQPAPYLWQHPAEAIVQLNNHDLYWIVQQSGWFRDEVLASNVTTRSYAPASAEASNTVTFLTSPAAVVQVRHGSGWILIDEILWENETRNMVKADRYVAGLLTGLCGGLYTPPELLIKAEWMANATNIYSGVVHLWSNRKITMPAYFSTDGDYLFTISAGGTSVGGTNPLVAFSMDGVTQKMFFVTSTSIKPYEVISSVASGTHTVGLAFINDDKTATEDRNCNFDRITITLYRSPFVQWQAERFTPEELLSPAVGGAEADPDGDGLDNEGEYAADTDPQSDASVLRVNDLRFEADGLHINWQGGFDADQLLLSCDDLLTDQWTPVFTNLGPTSVNESCILSPGTATNCYYRLKAWKNAD